MVGAGGLVASIIAFAVGAILDFAVTVNPDQHGFNVNKVGVILMIVGAVGAVLSLIAMVVANTRRRRTVVDDGQGSVARRVDSTYWEQRLGGPTQRLYLKEDPSRKGNVMSTVDKAKNKIQEAKGHLKESAGKATDDRSLQAKGKRDQSAGNLKQAGEKVKDAVKK
jgi:uncharacterized protein YjbJ (UPF0337 family)